MRRRHLLASTATLLAGLAGCSGSDGTDTPEPTPSATATRSPTSSPTPVETSTSTAGAGDTPDPATPTDSDASSTATTTAAGTPTPDVAQVVEVAADFDLRFAPEDFEIAAGETVRWTWVAPGHNVRADSTPADAEWQGTPGGDGTTYDEGYTHEYTFDVPGEYEYVCIPHENAGMTGSFTVTE